MSTLAERLRSSGPKRVLALDGGGVRGILSLAILERIEAILRERAPSGGSPAAEPFRLAHYFDLIGGTSTGSIIAAGLALGHSVSELFGFYRELSPRVFRRPFWSFGLVGPRFSRRPLAEALHGIIGDVTLGSDRLLTGLAIVTKRMDTGSVWVLHNNPHGRYFARRREGRGVANGEIPLASAILASTAAPTFFRPEFIKVTDSETGAFIDGGVSPHSDPSLQLLMLATLKGYRFEWPLGADRLMLVSVGTGSFRPRRNVARLRYTPSVFQAVTALTSMISDGSRLVQTVLQWASQTPTPRCVDREIGDLAEDRLGHMPLLHYVRYDAQLELDWLAETLDLQITPRDIELVQKMDDPLAVDLLIDIGRAIARRHVDARHFPAVFDAAIPPEPNPATASRSADDASGPS